MSFSFEQEKKLKAVITWCRSISEKGKVITAVYRKSTLRGVCNPFESFLPTQYKFGMVYTLAYRCFKICTDWTKFHEELSFLKQIFLKNGYPL